jgi:spore coat polysaccharide biosynthesis protein SpsF
MTNVDIFIPARLDSKRLPKKHLLKINEKPIIKHIVDRLSSCKTIRNIVVCTTTLETDDELIDYLINKKILFFRGHPTDILQRFLDASEKFDTTIIVDVEGDKLFTDPQFVDQAVNEILLSNYDFVMGSSLQGKIDHSDHSIPAVFPAVFTKDSLKKLCSQKTTKNTETGYREFFTSDPNFICKFVHVPNDPPKNLRLTIDYVEDFEFATKLLEILNDDFSYFDILNILKKKPELMKIIENLHERWLKNYNQQKTK